ncbi:hypothetical protein W824_15015 [Clavibacter cf. michiganensis LMG 26808]|uniref:Single-stranded DNA-binding protein n=2 Tax=Clavibacter TaxID=1573 RepID=A0A399NZD4_9MICO|nr:hypothetical protein W824_15015 [Clavibacter cf. michiganensis LMG 26808]RII99078.1 hypothetical protein DZF96_00090 [Clavibacter michiganensis]
MRGTIIDGPVLADTDGGELAATFTYADTAGRTVVPFPRACCEVVCRGSLAVAVLLDLRAGADVRIDGELRLHRPLRTGEDEDLVLATVDARSVSSAMPRVARLGSDTPSK